MKFDNLSDDEKFEYFWLTASDRTPKETFLMLGVKYDEGWERKSKGELDEYFKKYYPAAYKKAVQIGYKESMDSVLLSGTPKGYKSVRKADIIAAVAKKANTTQKTTKEIVDAYWNTIKETLKKDKTKKANINIPNVGSIRCVTQAARKYNVSGLKNAKKKGKSGTITVKSKSAVKFYVSDNFLTKSASTPKSKAKKTTAKSKSKAKTSAKSKTKKNAKNK
jgi:nucleoid DNA-binding protein